jgi:hypothetical protein
MRDHQRICPRFQRPRLVGTDCRKVFPLIVDFWDVQEVEEFKGAWLNHVLDETIVHQKSGVMTNPYSGTTLSDARVGVFIDDTNWDAVLEERQRCDQICWPSAYLKKKSSVEMRPPHHDLTYN